MYKLDTDLKVSWDKLKIENQTNSLTKKIESYELLQQPNALNTINIKKTIEIHNISYAIYH